MVGSGNLASRRRGTCAGSVVLSGGHLAPRGALYAVNHFVEALGVQFLAQDTTVLPAALPKELPPMLKHGFVPKVRHSQPIIVNPCALLWAACRLGTHTG